MTGTQMIEMGASIKDVGAQLGHRTLATTERYLHTNQERLQGFAEKLSGTIQAQSAAEGQSVGTSK